MKTYTKSAIILLAALSLVGCSKTVEFQNNPDSALQIESVSGISPFTLMQEPVSRAVITGESLPNNESAKGIGLFVKATDGGAYDGKTEGFSNVRYTYNGERWSTTTPVYLSKTEGKLYGYFPYSEAATDLTAIPVASSLNGTDYLYATPNDVSYEEKSVNLQMNHALARFHLTIKKGDKYLKDCDLSKIAIESNAIAATGTMDITKGTVAGLNVEGTIGCVVFDGDGVKGTVTKAGIEKDILLVPAGTGEGKKDLTLTLTIDGVEAKIKFSGEGGLDIRSGIQCNATIEIQDTGIKVIGVGVDVWGEGGSQTVQIDGHTVIVKMSDDVADAGIADNLYTQISVSNDTITIGAYSKEVKPLIIRIDDCTLIAPVESGNFSTFTISDITKDITATLAYAKIRTVTYNKKVDKEPNVTDYEYGKVEPIKVIEGRPSTLTATIGRGYAVYFNVKGTIYGDKAEVVIPNDVETIDAYFRFTDLLGGVFSVSDSTKVRFSRGNLWCEHYYLEVKAENLYFETNQYECTPLSEAHDGINDSHRNVFLWCMNATLAARPEYTEQGTSDNDNLFTNASPISPSPDFAVNGQKGFWRVLSGGDSGEWKYLIDRKGGTLCKFGVTVCGRTNCLILLPDDWKWGENGVGNDWQDGGYSETSAGDNVTWKTMEAAGAVCLPATGYVKTILLNPKWNFVDIGKVGRYWSSTPNHTTNAYSLEFTSDSAKLVHGMRDEWETIRLVTDVK